MKRIHLSQSEHLSKDVTYLPTMAADHLFKPCGLWYAMDDEWQQWCYDESIPENFAGYKYRYELEVDLSSICVLDNVDSVMSFHREYGYKVQKGNFTAIDWKKVMTDYAGIEIRNYQTLKLACAFYGVIWLRNWAVDGGCLWDLTAVNWMKGEMNLARP